MIFTRDLTTDHLSQNDLYESYKSGNGGECEECGEVETNEKVSESFVTVPLPLIRYDMDVSGQTTGAGSRYADVWG